LLGGLAGLLAAASPTTAADAPDSPIAHGVLADNAIARSFVRAPEALPRVLVDTPDGTVPITDILKGRTVLMPIWAEWCVPCLIEIPDFARLQHVYSKDKFAILPVLSGARKQMNPAAIAALFAALNATVFTPMVEHHYGAALLETMGRDGNSYAIPCNVLIGPDGKVVAREIGLDSNGVEVTNDPADRYGRAEKAAAGQTQSLWGTSAGDEFAVVMATDFLH
jgi:thiol-disulfide isomerase/thioredoxin